MSQARKFLVTGASGYLASWICRFLLEDGHTVHATVRDLAKVKKTAHLQHLKEQFTDTLHFFQADLLSEHSFKAAMDNCEYVVHTASPFFIDSKNPEEELIKPAVEGTRYLLETVNKTPSVKRVVLTSSMAAIKGDAQDVLDQGGCVDESHWNETSSVQHNPYMYSKAQAEKLAWEIVNAQEKWDLVAINPGFILGPSLSHRKDSTSISFMCDLLRGAMPLVPDIYLESVDVRDVARAHIQAALIPEAEGRHILVNKQLSLLDMAAYLKKNFSQYSLPIAKLPKWIFYLVGKIAAGYTFKMIRLNYGINYRVDNQKSINVLKVNYRDMQETFDDHAQQVIDSGLVKKR